MNRISHLFFQPFPPQASSTGKQPPSGFHVQHASTRRCCLYPPLLPLPAAAASTRRCCLSLCLSLQSLLPLVIFSSCPVARWFSSWRLCRRHCSSCSSTRFACPLLVSF
jgi:hypothetical protein